MKKTKQNQKKRKKKTQNIRDNQIEKKGLFAGEYMWHMLLSNRPHSSIKILFSRRLLLVIGAVSVCRRFQEMRKVFAP